MWTVKNLFHNFSLILNVKKSLIRIHIGLSYHFFCFKLLCNIGTVSCPTSSLCLCSQSRFLMYYVILTFCCRFDETKEPHRCCGQEDCLSSSERVSKLLDPEVLEVQLCQRFASGEDSYQQKPENYRFVAYRNIFFLIYGRTMPRMSRKPLPSCVMIRIRAAFPDPKDHYTGFRFKKQRKQ